MKAIILFILLLICCSASSTLYRVKLSKQVQINQKNFTEIHKKTLHNHLNSQEEESILLLDFEKVQYTGFLGIGSNGNLFNLIFDTGSSYIWVASDECQVCLQYEISQVYDCNLSPSCVEIPVELVEIVYGSGSLTGELVEDTVSIGSFQATGQNIILALDMQNFVEMDCDGLFGLGFEPTSDGRTTFVNNLKLQGQITDRIFSFYLGGYPDSYTPQFTLNGFDSRLIDPSDTLVYCDAIDNTYWGVQMKSIEVGTGAYILNQNVEAIIDSGTSFIGVNQEAFQLLFDNLNLYVKCVNLEGYITCLEQDQTLYPNIILNVCGNEFVLSPEDYIYQTGDYLIISVEAFDMEYVILGNIFMRKFYTVFDMEKNQIGFAKAVRGGENIDWEWAAT